MSNLAQQIVETPQQLTRKPVESIGSSEIQPVELIKLAISQNADIDKLQRLLDLKERWDAAQAKNAYHEAKAAFAAEEIIVQRDKLNKQYGSNYTSIGNLVGTVRPYLGKYGLDPSWEIDQSSGIRVTCILTHKSGHSERATMVVPKDESGQKNPIQQIKSSITYARILTFEAVCGLATSDPTVNVDDDGNSAGNGKGTPAKRLDEGRLSEICEWLENAGDREELERLFRQGYKEAKDLNDKTAMGAIIRKKDQEKKRF